MTRLTYLGITCRLLLGILWLVAALLKASDFGGFREVLTQDYRLPQFAVYLAMLLPALETLVGLCLLIEFKVREALWATIVMLSGFCLMIGYGLIGGNLESCGCLGSFSELSPSLAVLRNVACIGAALCALRFEPTPVSAPWKGWILGAACTLAALATGTSVEEPHFQQPTLIYGEQLIDLDINLPELNDGPVAIFIFKAGCSKCWDALPQIQTLQNEPRLNVLGITPSTHTEIETLREKLQPQFPIHSISQETYEDLDVEIPAILLLHNGVLKAHLEGRIPTLESIQHFSEAWFSKYLDGQALTQ